MIDADTTEGQALFSLLLHPVVDQAKVTLRVMLRIVVQDPVGAFVGIEVAIWVRLVAPVIAVNHQERRLSQQWQSMLDASTSLQSTCRFG